MSDKEKLRQNYYKMSKEQKEDAWKAENYDKANKIRQEQKTNYEKWKLLDGIIKAERKMKDVQIQTRKIK